MTHYLNAEEWIDHLKIHIETHSSLSAPDKSYILVVLKKIKENLHSSEQTTNKEVEV